MMQVNAQESADVRHENGTKCSGDVLDDPRCRYPTALYRYYGEDGLLLYVGITSCFQTRHKQHFKEGWLKLARSCAVETFPTRALAEWAEMEIIDAEGPAFNAIRFPSAPFQRKSDMWYLKLTGGKPEGVNLTRYKIEWPHGPYWLAPLKLRDDGS